MKVRISNEYLVWNSIFTRSSESLSTTARSLALHLERKFTILASGLSLYLIELTSVWRLPSTALQITDPINQGIGRRLAEGIQDTH